jgi:hypothetical protein
VRSELGSRIFEYTHSSLRVAVRDEGCEVSGNLKRNVARVFKISILV